MTDDPTPTPAPSPKSGLRTAGTLLSMLIALKEVTAAARTLTAWDMRAK